MSLGRPLPDGAEVAGYTVGGVLGRGGTAVVYRATHPEREAPVALKLIDPARWGPDAQALLERESRLAAAVAHRHILPVYAAGRENGRPFVAMRLEPRDLAAALREERRLDPTRAVRCVAQLGSALDAAHAHGLVHRDIKPSNVLLGEEDGAERAYLADFGIARAAFSDQDAFGDGMVGTVGYLSPEQIRGTPLDGHADVYSLGCLLYECLVGRLPFRRPTSIATLWAHLHEEPTPPTVLVPALPQGLDRVVLRALAKDPHARYGSAGSLANAALEAVGGRRPGKTRVSTRVGLPTGTVTFLAADVHGSARVQRGLGADADADELVRALRETCAAYGGVEAECRGDLLLIAFGAVSDAVEAASAFASLHPETSRMRVGLHTGTPHLTSEGYVGADLERSMEIASCGHGGQILVSGATAERLDARDTVVRELGHLGAHRLERLGEPVTLFQLGDGSFPPLKTVATTNLPAPFTSFVGRNDELDDAARLLVRTRMLTVTGPGGAGKTRFALELARRAREERFHDYPDGVFACFFAPLRDPTLVLPTVAQALSIGEQAGTGVLESLASHLAGRRVLLLCDNLEHLLAAASDLAALLDACPGVTLLCTSREPLDLSNETRYVLPPLVEEQGVELFCERARVEPDDTIRELCVRLEGLPLAIELAAARLQLLSPEQLLARLSQRLDLLDAGRDADPRQQTLRATIQWSYDLLSHQEQRLLRRLSVFVGGCGLEAAEEVAEADLDALQSLLGKSLLRRDQTEHGPRFAMLETVREFAAETLDESGETEAVRVRHDAFFGRLATEIASERWGTSSLDDRVRFDADRANLESVVFRALSRGDGTTAIHVLRLLGDHLHTGSGHRASLGLIRDALSLRGERPDDRAHVLLHAARLAAELGLLDEHRSYSAAAEALFVELEDTRGLWQVIQERATYASVNGRHAEAAREAERAIEIGRSTGVREMQVKANGVLATAIACVQFELDEPDPGELRRARDLFEQFVEWAVGEGTGLEQAVATANLAWFLNLAGEHVEALRRTQDALRLTLSEHVPNMSPSELLLEIAALAARVGEARHGAVLAGFSRAALERDGVRVYEIDERNRSDAELLARTALGEEAYEEALAEGRRLSLEQAVELGLAVGVERR
jgi:predicted ATPase